MMPVRSLKEWQNIRRELHDSSVGFVPTMGALHAGHVSLFERSRRENQISVVSIYVNPTQFDDLHDLQNYPIQLGKDLAQVTAAGVDYVLLPAHEEIYADQFRYKVSEVDLSRALCGAHRPGHFDGVLTIVMKLLNLVQPTRAYFGEKDFQQLRLIDGMVKAFFMNCEIVSCPIVREADGLAMSSRNARLTPAQRELAPQFYRILKSGESVASIHENLQDAGFRVDYVEDRMNRRFGAVHLGSVRLIDNVPLESAP